MTFQLPPDLRQIALRQCGLVTAGQAVTYGVTRKTQSESVRRGDLVRVIHGVFMAAPAWETRSADDRYDAKLHAATLRGLARLPRSALSHRSAAFLHSLVLLTRPSDVDVTQTSCRTERRPDGILLHRADLTGAAGSIGGRAVTTLDRTVVDCAAVLSFTDGVAMVESAMHRLVPDGDRSPETAARVGGECRALWLEQLGRQRPRGASVARKAIEFAGAASESAAESLGRVVFRSVRLPEPAQQVKIRTRGRVYYADFGFYRLRVIAEVDGQVKYRQPYSNDVERTMAAERQRHNDIQELGWEIVRFTWADLHDPGEVYRRIMAAAWRARDRAPRRP